MMRRLLSALALILPPALHAEPARPEITGLMERVADWQLAHPAKWQAHEWHNGAFYAGVMALAGGRPALRSNTPSWPRLRPAAGAVAAITLSTRRKRE